MNIAKIDSNFNIADLPNEPIVWTAMEDADKISIHGLLFDNGEYRRMPKSVSSSITPSVDYLSTHSAGARLTFKTNSPFIAIKGKIKDVSLMCNMALFGVYGFAVYEGDFYRGTILPKDLGGEDTTIQPSRIDFAKNERFVDFAGFKTVSEGDKIIRINLPLYTSVAEVSIGIKEGSYIEAYSPYKDAPPIVFYGSSITQGACASRAGLEYSSQVAEEMGYDSINLGFAGNCKGEKALAEYISTIESSLFVLEYDHNATVEHLKNTHFAFYEILRNVNKNTPILFISRPSTDYFPDAKIRSDIIKESYQTARAQGDNHVFFIDGEEFYGEENRTLCTADTCHPNDVGFTRMAKVIIKYLKGNEVLKCQK